MLPIYYPSNNVLQSPCFQILKPAILSRVSFLNVLASGEVGGSETIQTVVGADGERYDGEG